METIASDLVYYLISTLKVVKFIATSKKILGKIENLILPVCFNDEMKFYTGSVDIRLTR